MKKIKRIGENGAIGTDLAAFAKSIEGIEFSFVRFAKDIERAIEAEQTDYAGFFYRLA